MLTIPAPLRADERVRPLLALVDAQLATAAEAAEHLRYDVQHLANMRRHGHGPAYVKLGGRGAIRYRVSELLAWEIAGHGGGVTIERVAMALAVMPELTPTTAAKIVAHLRQFFGVEK